MSEAPGLLAIDLGLEASAQKLISGFFPGKQLVKLEMDLEKLLEPPAGLNPNFIFVGTPPAEVPLMEVIQTMRMHFPNQPIFFLTSVRDGLDKKLYLKNGFTEVFLLPFDQSTLETRMKDEISLASGGKMKSYKAVKLIDLEPGVELGFDTSVFLPLNKKYVKLSSGDDALDPARVKKLQEMKTGEVFVEKSQMQKFYDFSANQLKKIGAGTISETEKRDKMSSAVKNLLGGLFTGSTEDETHEQGKQIMENCQNIVKSYILSDEGESKNWYSRLMDTLNSGTDNYSHAGNVSTFAALFSIGTRIGKPDELALAGLMHDIGITDLPPELQAKPLEELTPEEQVVYYKHPEHSINLAKKRKIVIPEKVQKMIMQHHERYDGSGFPNKLVADRIMPEAQILAIADLLDDLTAVKEGKKKVSPAEAIRELQKQVSTDITKMYYDPKILDQILKLFPNE